MTQLNERAEVARAGAIPTMVKGTLNGPVVGALAITLAVLLLTQNVIAAVTDPPTYATPMREVLAYHAHNRIAVAITVGLEALNLPLLLGFVAGLHGMVGRRGTTGTYWSRLAVVAAATFSAIMVLYAVLWIGVVLSAGQLAEVNPAVELIWRMHAAAFAFSLPALGTTLCGVAMATRTSQLTPRWQVVLGVVSAGLLVAAGSASLAIAEGSQILFVGLAGYAGWIVWLLAIGARLVIARVPVDPN